MVLSEWTSPQVPNAFRSLTFYGDRAVVPNIHRRLHLIPMRYFYILTVQPGRDALERTACPLSTSLHWYDHYVELSQSGNSWISALSAIDYITTILRSRILLPVEVESLRIDPMQREWTKPPTSCIDCMRCLYYNGIGREFLGPHLLFNTT